ncbi:MAG TPA: hypothetical protein VN947_25840 [Polyangia bacterium]|nr:hypothetical protein [Polyangia bacterium]
MRGAFVVVVLLLTAVAHADGGWVFPDEDDPKLARGEVHAQWWETRHDVPRVKLSYRRMWAASPDGGDLPFDAAELDFYPVSKLVRLGLTGEVGYGGGNYGLWYFVTGATLGLQWPMRVTPFLEGRFVAGIIGGSFMGQSAVSWIYEGGIETGVEVYVASRFYLSAAIGWAHPVYGGVDVTALNETQTIVRKDFATDSFTFKVGLGL